MMRLTAAIGMMTVIAAASFAAEKGGVYRLHSSDTRSISQGSCVAIDMPDKRQHFLTVGHVIGGNMQVENDGRFFPVEKVASWQTHIEPVVLVRQVKPSGKWREYPLATRSPERGEQLCLAGFPRGRFRGFWSPVVDVQHLNDSFLITRGEADHGASGGAVLTRAGELVGLISSVDRGETLSVNLWDTISRNRSPKGRQVQWRCERGQCYPMYVQPVYPAIAQQQPSRPTVPRPVDQPAPSVDMDEVLRDVKIEVVSWLESNRDQLRGSDGQDGNSPELDLNELADVITSKYSDRIKGRDGVNGDTPVIDYYRLSETVVRNFGEELRGPEGQRGLVGVPDNEDIRNWLVGATADPEAQATLAKVFADLIASDPRVGDLIQRLEYLEANQYSGSELAQIDARFAELEDREVPFVVLNSDGSTFSKGMRKAFDPITIKLRPPEEM